MPGPAGRPQSGPGLAAISACPIVPLLITPLEENIHPLTLACGHIPLSRCSPVHWRKVQWEMHPHPTKFSSPILTVSVAELNVYAVVGTDAGRKHLQAGDFDMQSYGASFFHLLAWRGGHGVQLELSIMCMAYNKVTPFPHSLIKTYQSHVTFGTQLIWKFQWVSVSRESAGWPTSEPHWVDGDGGQRAEDAHRRQGAQVEHVDQHADVGAGESPQRQAAQGAEVAVPGRPATEIQRGEAGEPSNLGDRWGLQLLHAAAGGVLEVDQSQAVGDAHLREVHRSTFQRQLPTAGQQVSSVERLKSCVCVCWGGGEGQVVRDVRQGPLTDISVTVISRRGSGW